jgi:hypothetical protein
MFQYAKYAYSSGTVLTFKVHGSTIPLVPLVFLYAAEILIRRTFAVFPPHGVSMLKYDQLKCRTTSRRNSDDLMSNLARAALRANGCIGRWMAY